jgi:hypothetical protein
LDLSEERREMFSHQAMQDRLLRPPPLAYRTLRAGAARNTALRSSPFQTQTREPRSRGTATWQVPEK